MSMEDLGGLKGQVELDIGPYEASVKKITTWNDAAAASMQKVERQMQSAETASKTAAGSIQSLSERARVLRAEMEKLDPDTKAFTETAKRLKVVTTELQYAQDKAAKATVGMQGGFMQAAKSSGTLSVALGYLGATSIQMVIFQIANFIKQSVLAAAALETMQRRAQVIYGTDFPRVSQEAERMAQAVGRSSSDLLGFMTDFSTTLDNLSLPKGQITDMSRELTQLTVDFASYFGVADQEAFDAVQGGVLGMARALKRYGIDVSDAALQSYAYEKGIRDKVAAMSEEQKQYLRTQKILEDMHKIQGNAAESANTLTNRAKNLTAQWKDLEEAVGGEAMKGLPEFLFLVNVGMRNLGISIDWVSGTLKNMAAWAWNALLPFGKIIDRSAEIKSATAVKEGMTIDVTKVNRDNLPAVLAEINKRKSADASAQAGSDTGVRSGYEKLPGGAGGGGGADNSAIEDAKRILSDIDKIEKDLVSAYGEEAKANKDRRDKEKDILETKKKMGIITKDEERELDTLYRRTEYMGDKVQDATDAWEAQKKVVQDVQKEVDALNEKIVEGGKKLQDDLDKIDQDATHNKEKKIADLLKEQAELEGRIARGEGLNGEQAVRYSKLADILKSAKADSPNVYAEGEKISGLNELQTIDYETGQKKKQTADEANKVQAQLVNDLADANNRLSDAQKKLAEKQGDVTAAMDDLTTKTTAAFTAIEDATLTHVATQVTQLEIERAAVDRLAASYAKVRSYIADPTGAKTISGTAVSRAEGGPVYGPGGPTDDAIPAWLSNGEYVVNARAYSMNRDLVHAINSGVRLQVPRFAQGGPVSTVTHADRSLTVNNYGESAKVMSQPHMLKWYGRLAIR